MTKTLLQLRQGLCERLGSWHTGIVTTNGTTSTIIDTLLADLRTEPSDSQYILYTDATVNTGEIRRIKNYDPETDTITLSRAFTSSTVATDTYELHTFHPDDITRALNYARNAAYPAVHQVIDEQIMMGREGQSKFTLPTAMDGLPHQVWLCRPRRSSIADNLLDSDYASFETWDSSSDPAGWGSPTNLTLSQCEQNEMKISGSYSCRCVGTTSAGVLPYVIDLSSYGGQTLSLSAHIYCRSADEVKVAIYDGTTAHASTAYHQGLGWEWITVSTAMIASPSSTSEVRITNDAPTTAFTYYVDEVILWVGLKPAPADETPLFNYSGGNGVLEFPYYIPEGYPIRVKGVGKLSAVTTDISTMEVNDPQTELIYAEAAYYLQRQYTQLSPAQTQISHEVLKMDWEAKARRLRKEVGMALPAMKKNAPDWGL